MKEINTLFPMFCLYFIGADNMRGAQRSASIIKTGCV